MSEHDFTLIDNRSGERYELDIRKATAGPDSIDLSGLYRNSGHFSFDPGFLSTASCESEITFIDGEQGILRYRGYPIEELAESSSYIEVCYLLLNGKLPTQDELHNFSGIIGHHTMVRESLKTFFHGFHHDAHPMAIMVGVVGSLSAFYYDSTDIYNSRHREIAAHRLIAKMPTIAAACYKKHTGEPFRYPINKLSYTANFLQMMFSVPCEEYEIDPVAEKALDLIFILHADHEQNASTSTVRLSGSSGANPFACTAAGIASLWGPSHGGANEAVLSMLDEIGDVSNIDKYLAKAKDKNDAFRLMGFGHRIYKNYDPRARIIRNMCHEVIEKLAVAKDDPIFDLALQLEELALKDDYFIRRNLYPNVDFYSGIIYKALNIPSNMFTVMFAISRTVGWVAHWMEMMSDPQARIGRPRQLYTGAPERHYVDINNR